MRSLAAISIAFALGGCQPRTEIVLGFVSDMKVPSPLAAVSLDVERMDVTIVQGNWPANGTLALPGTYGIYSSDGSEVPVAIDLTAIRDGQPSFSRSATVTLQSGRTLFLRLALASSCANVQCAGGTGCVEGACVSTEVDPRALPDYSPELATTIECDSGTTYVDSSTGAPLTPLGACPVGKSCREGVCYSDIQ